MTDAADQIIILLVEQEEWKRLNDSISIFSTSEMDRQGQRASVKALKIAADCPDNSCSENAHGVAG